MKILITEQQLNTIKDLNELGGISMLSRSWGTILRDVMRSENTKKEIVIFGDDYPEAYEKFPVDYFYIQLGGITAYDENKSGYQNGKYMVYLHLPAWSKLSEINHELKHAFEDYMRMSKGKPGMSKSREGDLFFSGDFQLFMNKGLYNRYWPYGSILTGLYLTSKIEQSAFSDTVFDGEDWIIGLIKKSIDGSLMSEINHTPKENLEKTWNRLKQDIHIPIFKKFDNYTGFILWADKYIKQRGEKVLKKLLNVKYLRKTMGDEMKKEEN